MHKINYENLDSLIVKEIQSGSNTFAKIFNGAVVLESVNIADLTGREPFRVVDGRLQVLRKKGRINFNRSEGWYIAKERI